MKVLHLTLKKKWFDMIASGEKKEEYREIKQHWMDRLWAWGNLFDDPREFSAVEFKNGYGKNSPTMLVEWISTEVGKAKPEWSDNWEGDVFVIRLGSIITKNF